jgi:RHS repeat-associated protein
LIHKPEKVSLSDTFSSIAEPLTLDYGINYSLESVSIDGDGRIKQARSGDSVDYSYDFYLKDHLGSTRMVVNDERYVTENMNYQAYGTLQPLDSAAPSLPSREKFTGKEFDVQGADFARVEYDLKVSSFNSSPLIRSGALRVTYKDIASNTTYTKVQRMQISSGSVSFIGSESFISDVKIERIQLYARGMTYTVNNNAFVDSFIIRPGKTRKIELEVTAAELNTYIDSSFYTITAPVDNTTYFSGTKLFYFGARYYDPELGIWLSVDPASQFANAYAYAGNGANPVIMVDEDGNFIFSTLSLVIIGVSAAISGTMTAVKIADAGGNFGQVMAGFVIGSAAGAVGGALGTITGGAATAGVNAALGAFSSTFAGGLIGATVGGAAGGAVGGAASGLVGGTFTSLAMNQDLGTSLRTGFVGMLNGTITGAVTGAAAGAAGYGVGKGVETLRNARNAGGQPTALAKSAQKTDVNFVKEVSNAGAEKSLELTVDGPIQSNTNAPDYNPNKYYKITNPSQPQTPTIKLPVAPTNVPTNGVQMPPLNINPLPQGVTPAGNGSYYMITPNADYFYYNTNF